MRFFIFIFFINFYFVCSQNRCGSEDYRSILTEKGLFINQKNISQNLNRLGQYTIPVVFHIIYNNEFENISDDQIISQLDVLNSDYNSENDDFFNIPDTFLNVASSSGIRFCLAQVDPIGNISSGITRTFTDLESFSMSEDKMKISSEGGVDPWDTEKYLNIWVCDLSGNLLGFATYPGTNPLLDGVVIDYQYLGVLPNSPSPYNLGRTATHEIGHYFGLEHTFYAGCSDWDNCDDTPSITSSTFGCPEFPQESCGSIDMTMNFMDYTNDACMYMFTQCQSDIMLGTLAEQRASLLENSFCFYNSLSSSMLKEYIYPNPFYDYIFFKNSNLTKNIIFFDYLGKKVYEDKSITNSVNLNHLIKGLYFICVNGNCQKVIKD